MQIVHESDAPLFITLMLMNVGDSTFFQGKVRSNVIAQIGSYRKKDNLKNFSKRFTTRAVDGGVKVWRLE